MTPYKTKKSCRGGDQEHRGCRMGITNVLDLREDRGECGKSNQRDAARPAEIQSRKNPCRAKNIYEATSAIGCAKVIGRVEGKLPRQQKRDIASPGIIRPIQGGG